MKSAVIVTRKPGKEAAARVFPTYSEALSAFRGAVVTEGAIELWCSRRGLVKRNKFAGSEAVKAEPPKAAKTELKPLK